MSFQFFVFVYVQSILLFVFQTVTSFLVLFHLFSLFAFFNLLFYIVVHFLHFVPRTLPSLPSPRSLRQLGTPPPVSPGAGEDHRQGLGKSLRNARCQAHDRKCGSFAGQLSACGGRRPSPRSHTLRSVGSCAGQRERAKDVLNQNKDHQSRVNREQQGVGPA